MSEPLPPERPPDDSRLGDAPAESPSMDDTAIVPAIVAEPDLPDPPPLTPVGACRGFAQPIDVLWLAGPLIPFARRAGAWIELPRISPGRALLEVLAVVFATFAGSITISASLAMLLGTQNEKLIAVPATIILGLSTTTVCLALLWEQGLSLRSIGWTRKNLAVDSLLGCGAFVVTRIVLAAMVIALYVMLPQQVGESMKTTEEALKTTLPMASTLGMILFMCFVGVWEEIAFRGFLLTRLQVVLKRWWLTVPVGAVLFGMGHLWQGGLATLQTTCLGVALGILFAWRKSLIPGLIFHVINNVISMLLLRAMP